MKRLFTLFLLLTIFYLTACQTMQIEKTDSADVVQDDTGITDTASHMKITAKNVDRCLRGNIGYSDFVVEATLHTIEKNIYTFGDLQVITGVYEEETLPITMFQAHSKYYKSNNYQLGERYILVVQTNDSVNYSGEIRYTDTYILCKLNRNHPEKIDKLLIKDFPMETMLGTRQELINIVAEEVGLQNAYYNPCDQYVHSDVISDIVQGADVVAKVRIDTVDNEDNFFIIEECDCTLLELYKGEILTLKEGQFHFKPKRYSTKAGEEYLVLLQLYESTEPKLIDYGQAAKKNAIIPLSDTERVNEVYAALGIEPEA